MPAKKPAPRRTSKPVAAKASRVLRAPTSTADERSVAASALAQAELEAETAHVEAEPPTARVGLDTEGNPPDAVTGSGVTLPNFGPLEAELLSLRAENAALREQVAWYEKQQRSLPRV